MQCPLRKNPSVLSSTAASTAIAQLSTVPTCRIESQSSPARYSGRVVWKRRTGAAFCRCQGHRSGDVIALKAATALERLDGVEIEEMDLLDPTSIDALVGEEVPCLRPAAAHSGEQRRDNKAYPLARDARGYESQFATNHLGHFQLVTCLWPALRQAKRARVVSVSSWGHLHSPVVFEDPNFKRRDYDRWSATPAAIEVGQYPFCRRAGPARRSRERACLLSLHPGSIVGTGLEKHLSREELRNAGVIDENGKPVLDPARNLKTVEQAAATSVWCATSTQLDGMGGVYCENCDIAAPWCPKNMRRIRASMRCRGSRRAILARLARRLLGGCWAQSIPRRLTVFGG